MALRAPLLALLLAATAAVVVVAQNATSSALPSTTHVVTSVPVTRPSVARGSTIQVTQFVPTTIVSAINASSTAAPSSTTTATATNSPTVNPTAGPVLDTRVDPAFGVLGALLVLTGLPSAFLGHKNRWSSFFLTGFYSLSLACLALILKYGVLVAVHPPNKTLRGLFVLACGVAGIAGGGISIFFWQQTKYLIGAWGGFALGLWFQCFRNSGLIRPIGLRWILYIGCGAIGFVLCTIPRLHYHVLIAGTAVTGASAFMLGVDCFTTAGLKEFYVYNLGFAALFPKFAETGFRLSQVMQVELGLIAAVALMGVAVQLRVLVVLKRKLREINEEERRREQAAEAKAVMRFAHVQRDLEDWEKTHGRLAVRPASAVSGTPLMKDLDEPSTPGAESTVIGAGARPRTRSGISELALGEDGRPLSRFMQSPGLLPAMNLGLGLGTELPGEMISKEDLDKNAENTNNNAYQSHAGGSTTAATRGLHADLLKKEELLAEIRTIRKSIDVLRSEASSVSGDSRHPSFSFASRHPSAHTRTLSGDGATALAPVATRPRARSMDLFNDYYGGTRAPRSLEGGAGSAAVRASDSGGAGERPRSTPLQEGAGDEDEWAAYLRERKLFQPPSGASVPLTGTPLVRPASALQSAVPVPDAVSEALARRRRRESAYELGGPARYVEEAGADETVRAGTGGVLHAPVPLRPAGHRRSTSAGAVTILPPAQAPGRPREGEGAGQEQGRRRTRTFEELVERHQEKLRALQEPLSAREREAAELEAAKRRWERTRRTEREEAARRRAEREAGVARRRGSGGAVLGEGGGGGGSGSRRMSTAKVQEWQRYQQEMDRREEGKEREQGKGAGTGKEQLPFPEKGGRGEAKRSRGRDPPS